MTKRISSMNRTPHALLLALAAAVTMLASPVSAQNSCGAKSSNSKIVVYEQQKGD